jgi:hypothetical protein
MVKHIEKSDGWLIRFGEEFKSHAYIAEVRRVLTEKLSN